MFILIDNYDSFTYNLVHFLGEIGASCRVFRNDAVTPEEVAGQEPEAIVLSPGPCTPNEAGICLDLVRMLGSRIPIFGVCLGHQSIAQAYGGEIVRADRLMHGKLSAIHHTGKGVLKGLPKTFEATRYHSLTVAPGRLPKALEVTATTENGTIMGLRHKRHPVHGVQFHPESIRSEHGHALLANFLAIAKARNKRVREAKQR